MVASRAHHDALFHSTSLQHLELTDIPENRLPSPDRFIEVLYFCPKLRSIMLDHFYLPLGQNNEPPPQCVLLQDLESLDIVNTFCFLDAAHIIQTLCAPKLKMLFIHIENRRFGFGSALPDPDEAFALTSITQRMHALPRSVKYFVSKDSVNTKEDSTPSIDPTVIESITFVVPAPIRTEQLDQFGAMCPGLLPRSEGTAQKFVFSWTRSQEMH